MSVVEVVDVALSASWGSGAGRLAGASLPDREALAAADLLDPKTEPPSKLSSRERVSQLVSASSLTHSGPNRRAGSS
jgi:hypothetical protein